jgi:hypothetical protein
MRVAVIAPPWVPVPPVGYGGTELVLDTLCRELARQGHEVLLYATGDSHCPVERSWTYDTALGTDGIGPGPEVRHVLDAYDRVREWAPDVVHDHTILGPFHGATIDGLPVITTNHGPFDDDLTALYRRVADLQVPVPPRPRASRSPASSTTGSTSTTSRSGPARPVTPCSWAACRRTRASTPPSRRPGRPGCR